MPALVNTVLAENQLQVDGFVVQDFATMCFQYNAVRYIAELDIAR